ncbi:membrane protein [Pandoraea thiooxydans]|uniref:Low temperature requirement protein A n=1 Tax=Pandoraea thiooxydans TaxID=445709 RepID=A0A0G3EMC3_9BURK|nr:low temperature requirement protein A [Pandoraea thiooxydans]AKJ68120.1 hypothetical protein ABW99_07750 [Pandoraea thiooxydans]APR95390.1 membrane protein [Pandoraea thiooxydans]
MAILGNRNLLRARDGHEAHVSFAELFFDLIYVFAVTQLSHRLLGNLTLLGALQTLVLWFAVWLGWQYTCWVTNWFDPETLPVRLLLFGVMLVGLFMAASIPGAFGARGLVFAGCYAAIQIGRTLAVVLHLGPRHALAPNFRRILGWTCIAGLFWIAGGLSSGSPRLLLWTVAVGGEYIAPMIGFWLPGLGRSRTAEWTIEGGHLAERCQLFVIMALGESILVTGATISHTLQWQAPVIAAGLVTFVGSLAMWWVYFDTGSKAGSAAIAQARDPGRVGAYFHYIHVLIVGGVIVSAVGNELVIAHPAAPTSQTAIAVLLGGPVLYLFGNGLYKTVVYGRFPLSHIAGLASLCALALFARLSELLPAGVVVMLVLIIVAAWESLSRRTGERIGSAR